jgi:hypothetical protein
MYVLRPATTVVGGPCTVTGLNTGRDAYASHPSGGVDVFCVRKTEVKKLFLALDCGCEVKHHPQSKVARDDDDWGKNHRPPLTVH